MNWAIGDIHGQLLALEKLVNEIQKRDPDAQFHFVGDFVDRGPESKRVTDLVMTLPGTSVRGNHDDIFDLIANDTATTNSGLPNDAAAQAVSFMRYGMADTLKSYGVSEDLLYRLCDAVENANNIVAKSVSTMFFDEDEGERDDVVQNVIAEVRENIPDNHKAFYRQLPLVAQTDDFFTIHAFVHPNVTDISKPDPNNAIWGRFLAGHVTAPKAWPKYGYFGHTPTKHYGISPGTAFFGEKMAIIDTGCTFGDLLTGVCHQTGEVVGIDRNGHRR